MALSTKLANAVNLTPHDVVLMDAEGQELMTFPASGHSLRVVKFTEAKISKATVAGASVEIIHGPRTPVATNFDDLPDLIRQAPAMIVSAITADAAWETMEGVLLFVPDTGPEAVVRDDKGQIRGVKRFILYDGQ
jgi:hypothetical protein